MQKTIECSSKEIMHHTRQKLYPIMKYTVQNKTQQKDINIKLGVQHQVRRRNLDNLRQ